MRTQQIRFAVWLLAMGLVPSGALLAQPVREMNAAELQLALQRLNVLGSVLYVAAHPDDENTAALAWFANDRLARTAYLAVTRGDGGQNLIGSEKAERMGLLRTQELLTARRIDGAQQYFTRAIDFGYSKSPEEALEIWGHEEILADVVWVIRQFRPDVVITRFSQAGGGHGHHTASAVLAAEAFEAAGDPTRFAGQLDLTEPWQPVRLMLDRRGGGDVSVDLGTFNPLLGVSYTEIAARSRSQHKSQGFGSSARRGPSPNSFSNTAGEPATGDVFDGIDLSWNRVPGGAPVAAAIERAQRAFRPDRPSSALPYLFEAWGELNRLEESPWVAVKRAELAEVIRGCAGIWIEAIADHWAVLPGSTMELRLTAVNRSPQPFVLESVDLPLGSGRGSPFQILETNRPFSIEVSVPVPIDAAYSSPYWLEQLPEKGRYAVSHQGLVRLPENPPAMSVRFILGAAGQRIPVEVPVLYRWTDPVEGEHYRDVVIAPEVMLELGAPVFVFGNFEPRSVSVRARSLYGAVSGTVSLEAPPGWSVEPGSIPLNLTGRDADAELLFTLQPGERAVTAGMLRAVAELRDGTAAGTYRRVAQSMVTVDYPHIPIQVYFPPSEVKLVKTEFRTRGERIGYVMGPGDEVPEALQQMGYQVVLLSDDDLAEQDLGRFDAIVTGVRAYNTRPRLAALQSRLLSYVEQGGTLVMQYNTNRPLPPDSLGPWPLEISRDRITVEEAPVTVTAPDHPLLRGPNRITGADFEGWVQERGLYFPGEWDDRYETVLTSSDPGEEPLAGGLLYGRYGDGVFIYTSYAFFRQLPAGVPGAWRLFANLVSAGSEQ